MQKIGLWQVTPSGPHKLRESVVDLEKQLQGFPALVERLEQSARG